MTIYSMLQRLSRVKKKRQNDVWMLFCGERNLKFCGQEAENQRNLEKME